MCAIIRSRSVKLELARDREVLLGDVGLGAVRRDAHDVRAASRALAQLGRVPIPGISRPRAARASITLAAAVISSISACAEAVLDREPPSPSPCATSITGTPAPPSAPAIARTCSTVNWWRIGCDPSRSVVSVIRSRRRLRVQVGHPHRGGGLMSRLPA